MDPLERAIQEAADRKHSLAQKAEEHRAIAADFEKQAAEADQRWKHMLEAARLRPLPSALPSTPNENVKQSRRGKRPGSISKDWVDALADLYCQQSDGRRRQASEIQSAYGNVKGKEIDISSARDRIRYFLSQDPPIMEGDYDKGFFVTKEAADKFSFADNETTALDEQPLKDDEPQPLRANGSVGNGHGSNHDAFSFSSNPR